MNKSKIFVILFYCLSISVMFFLAIFSRFDLSISMMLYDSDSTFSLFFGIFGEWPMNIMFLLSTVFLFMTRPKDKIWLNIVGILFWGFSCVLGAFKTAIVPVSHILQLRKMAISPMIYILVPIAIIVCVLVVKKVKKEHYSLIRKNAMTTALYFYISYFISLAIKRPWGRLRFVQMKEPLQEFTAWYLPQGFTGNESFISSHTINSCFCLLLVVIIINIAPNLKSKEVFLYIAAGLWIMCVAASRVVMGAHFTSDVTMSVILGVTLFLVLKKTNLIISF